MFRGLLILCVCAGGLACEPPPPLTANAAAKTLAADGITRTTITIESLDIIEGGLVQLTASRGALAQSVVPFDGQKATVELYAPLERELGRLAERPIDIVARVVVSDAEVFEAKTSLTATAPTTGAPILFVDADPPALVLGDGDVDIVIVARRVPDGDQLELTTTAGTLASDTVAVNGGEAAAVLLAPDAAADAIVTVVHAASGVSGRVHVRFADEGQPLYDLNGTFVQIGPARVKLTSNALTPNPQCVLAPSTVLVDLTQTGQDVEAHYTTCAVTFPSVTSIVGTVENFAEQIFYDAIPVVDATLTLSSPALGARYAPPPSVVVVGANLDDPEADALPDDENDSRVVDADGDGEPGVTVTNSIGGEQRIVYRNVGTTKGRVRSSVSIIGDEPGDLVAKTETSVFGIGGGFVPDTAALGSVMEVQRIDGQFAAFDADVDGDGAVSCQEAIDAVPVVTVLEPPDTPFDCTGIE